MRLKNWLMELRAPFFTASIVPILLGTAIAWCTEGVFYWHYFLAALFGGMLLHAGANVSNDYFDYKNGTDNINTQYIRPFTGGSRMIQNKKMTPKQVLAESVVLYILALAIGIWLISVRGLPILWLGMIGAFSGFFYTSPPFKLVSRGIGELFIGLNFGILITLGAYFVQTGTLSWLPVIAAIPVALLVAGILYINEFPDFIADRDSGKMHLVARMGLKKAATGYTVLLLLIYSSIIFAVVIKIIPLYGLAAILTAPLAIKAIKTTKLYYNTPQKMAPASAITIQLHLFIGLILSASYIIQCAVNSGQ